MNKTTSCTSNLDRYIQFTLSAVTYSVDDFNAKVKVVFFAKRKR